jgi:hypothetical protein
MENGQLLQWKARQRLERIVSDLLDLRERDKNAHRGKGGNWDRYHNTITINGGRGSGKTTFIQSFLDQVETSSFGDTEKISSKTIQVLNVIDPTLVENKENIIVTIISNIWMIVKAARDHHSAPDGSWKDQYKRAENALRKLAGGLCLLDGIGSPNHYDQAWDDPQIILQKGLSKARDGSAFARDFHDFLDACLECLGKKVFLLAFDDIDTQFERGWPVLEAIRKYLASSAMVVLLSGDLDLYTKLVRRAQYVNLGDTLLRHDRPNRAHHAEADLKPWEDDPIKRAVDHLEEQYLLKILKPENRITLSPLGTIVTDLGAEGKKISVSPNGRAEKGKSLVEAIDTVFEHILRAGGGEDVSLHRTVLLGFPVRTVLQFLRIASDVMFAPNPDEKALRDVVARLPHLFASGLYHFDLSPLAIAEGDEFDLTQEMIRWCTGAKLWGSAYGLRPEYGDRDRDMVAMVLAVAFSQRFWSRPGDALSYMISIGLTREFVTRLGEDKTRAIIHYLGSDRRERLSSIARRAIGVQANLTQTRAMSGGVVPVAGAKIDTPNALRALYGVEYQSLGEDGFNPPDGFLWDDSPIKEWFQAIEDAWGGAKGIASQKMPYKSYVYNTLESLAKGDGERSGRVRLASGITENARGEDTTYLSIFTLLASIGDLLALDPEHRAAEDVAIEVRRLTQVRAYPAPPWVSRNDGAQSEGTSEDWDDDGSEDDQGEASRVSDFDGYVAAWLRSVSAKRIPLSATIYSRIMARFYYTLLRMDEALTPREIYAGHVLHRQIVAFLNAVLVEEIMASHPKMVYTLNNPTRDDTPFWVNFPFRSDRKEQEKGLDYRIDWEDLPLFHLFFSCPFFGLFLCPKETVKGKSWNLWETQLRHWPVLGVDDEGSDDEDELSGVDFDEFDALLDHKKSTLSVTLKGVAFLNLWAPLNSVPVFKGRMERPIWGDWAPRRPRKPPVPPKGPPIPPKSLRSMEGRRRAGEVARNEDDDRSSSEE